MMTDNDSKEVKHLMQAFGSKIIQVAHIMWHIMT